MNFNFVFFFNSILLGIGLAMDAFSVSMANGLSDTKMKTNKMLPRYIDFIFNKYRVRVRGVALGMYDTLEEAIKVKEDYLKK